MAERPRLKMVDDPLAPARQPPAEEATESPELRRPARDDAESPEPRPAGEEQRQSARSPARKPLQGIFGRVPPELARRLEGMVFELKADRARVSQQDVLAALLWRYIDHTDPESVRAMHELLDAYEAAGEG